MIMKRYMANIGAAAILACCACGCIEETFPTTVATPEQIEKSSSSMEYMLSGLSSFFMDYDTWGTSANTNDWGYPCQMYMREVLGEDFPVYDAYYDYWSYEEAGTSLSYESYYTWYYYYSFIRNANNVIALVPDPDNATVTAVHSLGQALGIRALMYMDLAAMFEYRKTEVSYLNEEAESSKIMGLTVPIILETTTSTELKNNPRAPFYTMYRFIMTDLNRAEGYLDGYEQLTTANVDLGVVYGLKARLWLDMASRFDKDASALAEQKTAEGSADGYDDLGISTATGCYAKAAEYAQKAIARGYTPLTEDQWMDSKTGFNTAQPSWMLGTYVTSKEEVNTSYYYCSFVAQMTSEPTWSMARYGSAFRCIGKSLYDKISDDDWRKASWIDPSDAGKTPIPSKYRTDLDAESWKELPAYANLKFRAGGGAESSIENGLIASLPLMRVEEMYFICFEAIAHTQSVAAAASEMTDFINTYRYREGKYKCSASDMSSFITELMVQRRIEFWGEGINFFAYKRLALPITRSYTDTNYISAHRLNTKAGYVAPWMNYYIPIYERDNNLAVILNPDASGSIISQ
jgi:starch-binding outer membrane protein, SusD/RagB family